MPSGLSVSSEMISSAEAKSRDLRQAASEYVENIMRESEEAMSSALTRIQTARRSIQSAQAAPKKEP